MPHTHDSKPWVWARGPLRVSCKSLFWHPQRYPRRRVAPQRPPLTEPANPRELEQPFRSGHARIFRAPLTRYAVVLGYWEPAGAAVLAEEEGGKLLEAVEGAHIPGVTATEISQWTPAADVLRLWDRLLAAWRRWWSKPMFADPPRSVVLGDALEGWEAEQGWSLLPWKGGPDDLVLNLEDARRDHL